MARGRRRSWAEAGKLAQPGIVADGHVQSRPRALSRAGIGLTLDRTKVGDRYVVEHMRAHGFNVGGEQSGHMILSDFSTTGDGLVSALQILAVVEADRQAGERSLPAFRAGAADSQECPLRRRQAARYGERQGGDRRGRARLSGTGRLVIRPSGTEPLIRVMAEGDDQQVVGSVVDDICVALKQVAA